MKEGDLMVTVSRWSRWSERFFGTPKLEPLVSFSFLFPVIYLVLFLIFPVLVMLGNAFDYNGHFSLYWFKSLTMQYYFNPLHHSGYLMRKTSQGIYYFYGWDFGVILNSIIVSLLVMCLTTLLGTIFAFVMARYDFPGKNVVRIMLFIPLLVTPFVNIVVVQKMFSPGGLIDWIFYDKLHIFSHPIWLDGLVGVIVAQTMTYYPMVYLNAYASFINIDPSLEEQAENLGSHGFHLFRTVTFPLALPGIAAGAVLVGIFSLEDLAAPIVFQSAPIARKLMSFQIYSAFTSPTGLIGTPQLSALALVMLAVSLILFFSIRAYVGRKQYSMLSKGGRWNPRVARPKWWQAIVIYLIVIPAILLTIFPQIGVILLALSKRWYSTWPQGFTFDNIKAVVTQPGVTRVIMNSLTYSTAAIVIILVLSLTSAYAVNRFKKAKLAPVLDSLSTIPIAVSGIVIAMSYFVFFSKVPPFKNISSINPLNLLGFNPAFLLILAYSIRRLPFAARSISAGMQQVHVSLEEAAMNLGAGRWRAVIGILMPMIVLNVLGGAMLSFVYCMSETSVGITLGHMNPTYMPITAKMKELISSSMGSAHLAAGLGVFLMAIQIAAIVLANLITKQRTSFIGVT